MFRGPGLSQKSWSNSVRIRAPEINLRSQNIMPEDASDVESSKQSKEKQSEAGKCLEDMISIEI